MNTTARTKQVYRVSITATPQAIWDAITRPERTERYGLRTRVEYDLRPGGAYRHPASPSVVEMGLPDTTFVGEVLEVDPPRKVVLLEQGTPGQG